MTSPTNAESLVFYQLLKDDAQKELDYWQKQAASQERATNLLNFGALINGHDDNIKRLKQQAADRGENILDGIKSFVEKIEGWIQVFGSALPKEVKEWLTKLINAAKKLLENLK